MMLYSIAIIDAVGAQTFLHTFLIYYSKDLATIVAAVIKDTTYFQNLFILGNHDFN